MYSNTLERYQGLGHSSYLKVLFLLFLLLLLLLDAIVPGQVFCLVPVVFDIIDKVFFLVCACIRFAS